MRSRIGEVLIVPVMVVFLVFIIAVDYILRAGQWLTTSEGKWNDA